MTETIELKDLNGACLRVAVCNMLHAVSESYT